MRRPLWIPAFLIALEQHQGNISAAADRVGKSRMQVYRLRNRHADFEQEIEAVLDRLESNLVAAVARHPQRASQF